ncbi:MAG: Hsp20/alpha crystallin family protein [Parachlamydiaceae bacterium]
MSRDNRLMSLPTLWSRFFENELLPTSEEVRGNGVRIYEENNELHVEVPMPGLTSDDLEVSLNKGVLWVKGEKQEEEEDKKRKFYRSSSRKYSYSLVLPTQIDEGQEPQAIYEDGLLKVSLHLPKQSSTKKIQVRTKS